MADDHAQAAGGEHSGSTEVEHLLQDGEWLESPFAAGAALLPLAAAAPLGAGAAAAAVWRLPHCGWWCAPSSPGTWPMRA